MKPSATTRVAIPAILLLSVPGEPGEEGFEARLSAAVRRLLDEHDGIAVGTSKFAEARVYVPTAEGSATPEYGTDDGWAWCPDDDEALAADLAAGIDPIAAQ
jgi:hypothetical protein